VHIRPNEKIWIWIAWRLPGKLVMWCGYRIGAFATMGEYGTTIIPELTFMDAMNRWFEALDNWA
jgi:hypothetical protein